MSGILGRLVGSQQKPQAVSLPPVEVHQIETNPDRRARRLKHLLKANHVNYSMVFNNTLFINHSPHLLSTAYLLGASVEELHALYEAEIRHLEPWTPSPAEIVDLDWRDFLGDKRYQRAYVDFFEDNLAMKFAYDWKKEVEHFLFADEEPLFHGLISGLGHPLVHLGYAYEMDCKEIAMEALGLACLQRDFLHKYFDDASYTRPSPLASDSPLNLLVQISDDERFSKLPKSVHLDEIEALFDKHQDLIMDYWNAWQIEEPVTQLQLSQEAAVSLLVTSSAHAYNFYFVHVLTASHALRVLLPVIPPQHHVTLMREWWLLVVMIFVMKGRPRPCPSSVDQDIGSKDWAYVGKQALTSRWSKDAHYIKAIRAMKDAAKTWGDANDGYLKAAVTFVDHFEGWAY
ncbi:hypothetical protein XA68_18119 [Ophiocordyceps unilateralis]|uniref:MGS207 protein n=1 Tax=Ophiocordyceps unilateralis TaxID=268505 RepID=A0A2A9P3U3_OPHUN|nr:hypothetical protein XA68_18119 [Ophiocordyceps unilateralis]